MAEDIRGKSISYNQSENRAGLKTRSVNYTRLGGQKGTRCLICLDDFKLLQVVVELGCCHICVHSVCVQTMLANMTKRDCCPVCDRSLKEPSDQINSLAPQR